MSPWVWAYTNCKHPDQVVKNMWRDPGNVPQSRRTSPTTHISRDAHLPRDTKGRKIKEQINQTNATYESIDAQIKKKCNTGTALERSVEKLLGLQPV